MSDCFIIRRGGGAGLNFKVVGGTTQPTNPKENTIWINTDAEITSWAFAPVDPYVAETELYQNMSNDYTGYLNSSGTVVSHDGWKVTRKILLPSGTTKITYKASDEATSSVYFAFYNSSGALVDTRKRIAGTNTYTVPSGATTMRLSVDVDNTSPSLIATYPGGENGDVWIATATSSPADFNALKKNVIQVSPQSVNQYVSGTWVNKTALIYQNGEWVDWDVVLYDRGNGYDSVTGGWDQKTDSGGEVTFGIAKIVLSYSGSSNLKSAIHTTNKVEISGNSKLCCDVDITANGEFFDFGLANSISTPDIISLVTRTTVSAGETGTKTVTVDLTGVADSEYLIVARAFGRTTVNIHKIWME